VREPTGHQVHTSLAWAYHICASCMFSPDRCPKWVWMFDEITINLPEPGKEAKRHAGKSGDTPEERHTLSFPTSSSCKFPVSASLYEVVPSYPLLITLRILFPSYLCSFTSLRLSPVHFHFFGIVHCCLSTDSTLLSASIVRRQDAIVFAGCRQQAAIVDPALLHSSFTLSTIYFPHFLRFAYSFSKNI
jgi:hypothetical protein